LNHPYISETPLRIFLRGQQARLERVIAESDQPWSVEQAKRHAIRFRHLVENETDMALEILAPGAGQPGNRDAIDDICRHVEAADLTRAVPHGRGYFFIDNEDLAA